MRPENGNDYVEIPLTFDVSSGTPPLTEKRLTLGFLIIVGIIIASIVFAIMLGTWPMAILALLIGAIAMTVFRMVWFNEVYYRKKMSELAAQDYVYSSKVIWDIYEIAPGFPVCSLKNGTKAVFVSFDKDIVVGKPDDNEFIHYEAIADALQTMTHKGISCMHLDYMDTVGKDGRLDGVVKNLLETPNEELRQLLSLVFEYQQYTMTKSYSTYDVFVFYYKYNDAEFQDDLQSIISSFMGANYIRYRLLGANQIRELVKSIYNLADFSVNEACDNVFKQEEGSTYIRVIWTECDGERKVFSKTSEEKAEERAMKLQQSQKKKKPVKKIPKPPVEEEEELIDIFADTEEMPVDEDITVSDEFIYLDDEDIMSDFTTQQSQSKQENVQNSETVSIFAEDDDDDGLDIF